MAQQPSKISIAKQPGKTTLSAAQRKFNGLIKKIEAQRQLLESWQTLLPLYQARWSTEFKPLLNTLQALSVQLVQQLDQSADTIKLTKADRRTLADFISYKVTELMGGNNDEAMKALFEKYSDCNFEEEQEQKNEALKKSLEQAFGIDLEHDLDMNSPEDIARELWEKLQAQPAENSTTQKNPEHKSKREIREEQEATAASQSVREVYRKLASALHPDRETDAAERERKTDLMQQVNRAYAERNLLDLLRLQLAIEQINPQNINSLAEKQLKHYNRILDEQLSELLTEVSDNEMAFQQQFAMEPYDKVTPKNIHQCYARQLNFLQMDVEELEVFIPTLTDTRTLKRWLKEQRQIFEEQAFADDFGDLYFR